MNPLDILHARQAMYLMPYQKKVDAASFFVNFLIAIFDSQELGHPDSIDITSSGQYFSAQANGCSFPESIDSVASLFDIANYRQPFFDHFYSLGFMRPLVWFSDYCVVEITNNGMLSQQAFFAGTPLSQSYQLPLDGNTAKIGFWFTLPTKKFEDVTLNIERLKSVITTWETGALAPLPPGEIRPILHKEWEKQSKIHYSLRLSTLHSAQLAYITSSNGSQEQQPHPKALALAI